MGRTVAMGRTVERVKGRAKETAGELTGSERLKREGRRDRRRADIKDRIDDFSDRVRGLFGRRDRPTTAERREAEPARRRR